jgi:hypothetical protein
MTHIQAFWNVFCALSRLPAHTDYSETCRGGGPLLFGRGQRALSRFAVGRVRDERGTAVSGDGAMSFVKDRRPLAVLHDAQDQPGRRHCKEQASEQLSQFEVSMLTQTLQGARGHCKEQGAKQLEVSMSSHLSLAAERDHWRSMHHESQQQLEQLQRRLLMQQLQQQQLEQVCVCVRVCMCQCLCVRAILAAREIESLIINRRQEWRLSAARHAFQAKVANDACTALQGEVTQARNEMATLQREVEGLRATLQRLMSAREEPEACAGEAHCSYAMQPVRGSRCENLAVAAGEVEGGCSKRLQWCRQQSCRCLQTAEASELNHSVEESVPHEETRLERKLSFRSRRGQSAGNEGKGASRQAWPRSTSLVCPSVCPSSTPRRSIQEHHIPGKSIATPESESRLCV